MRYTLNPWAGASERVHGAVHRVHGRDQRAAAQRRRAAAQRRGAQQEDHGGGAAVQEAGRRRPARPRQRHARARGGHQGAPPRPDLPHGEHFLTIRNFRILHSSCYPTVSDISVFDLSTCFGYLRINECSASFGYLYYRIV